MFPVKLFKVDEATKRIVATAAELGDVRGPGAIFETIGDSFGLGIDVGVGLPLIFVINEMIEKEDRLTYVLLPSAATKRRYRSFSDYKLVITAKFG